MKKRILFLIFIFSFLAANIFYASGAWHKAGADDLSLDEQELTIRAIKKIIPATVSIIVYDQVDSVELDLNSGSQRIVKEKKQAGSGSGFIITPDGLIITNKHVVEPISKDREYKVILNSGKQYYAQMIDRDPINDLAIIKIFDKDLPHAELGDSGRLELGTTVIAIGNALGRYKNSAAKGIVSGLERYLMTNDLATGRSETLYNVIQTDAGINLGNSGGPLINLEGEVVGINVAIDESGEAISFSIPINDAKPVIRTIKESGLIIRPKLGLRYIMLNPVLAEENGLSRETGAWVHTGDPDVPAIESGSPAQKAGIEPDDIIFEVNAVKIEGKTTLLSVLQRYKPGDKIGFKIQRGDKVLIKTAQLGEF